MKRAAPLLCCFLLVVSCKRGPSPEEHAATPAPVKSAPGPIPALLSALAAAPLPPPPAPSPTLDAKPLSDAEKATAKAKLLGAAHKEEAPKLKQNAKTSANLPGSCPLDVRRPNRKGEVVASWMALWKRLNDEHQTKFSRPFPTHGQPVTTDAEARHVLTGALNDGKKAWVVEMEDSDNGTVMWSAALALPDATLLVFPALAVRYIGRCRMGPWSAWLEDGDKPRVVVESINNELRYMCEVSPDRIEPCKDNDPNEKPVQSFCAAGTYGLTSFFLDSKTLSIGLEVEETGSQEGRAERTSRVSLVTQPDGVTVAGRGCNETIKFAP